MDLGLKGKNVFITASSEGIGYATAEAFLAEGAIVCINGRNEEKLERAVHTLGSAYGIKKVYGISGDMANSNDITRACEVVKQHTTYLDVLIGNLGTGKPLSSDKLSFDEWNYMLQMNLLSAVLLMQHIQDLFAQSGGSIVLLSSLAAFERIGAPPAYAAAKSGILSLVKYMAPLLWEKEIRINGVAPGNIYYPGGRWNELARKDSVGTKEYIERNVPLKRFGKPEEIAAAVTFLASERSSFTTGVTLQIDGGQSRGY